MHAKPRWVAPGIQSGWFVNDQGNAIRRGFFVERHGMAWIKVESVTPTKPEVLRLARLLGVSRDDAFGKVVRFWIWLDGASVDGRVDALVDADVDAVVGCDGFTSALREVGWAESDKSNGCLKVPNFDRHNGESAKKRAQKAKRQQKWRSGVDARVDADVDGAAPTKAPPDKRREEKIREEDNTLSTVPVDGLRYSVRWVVDLWNERAADCPVLRSVRWPLSDDRARKVKSRLSVPWWPEAFTDALERLPLPDPGDGRNWQPDLDWMVKADSSVQKIIEGKYDWRANGGGPKCRSVLDD